MIALAIRSVVHDHVKVAVPSPYVSLCSNSRAYIELPDEVITAIRKFDRQVELEPFEFDIEIPQEFLKC